MTLLGDKMVAIGHRTGAGGDIAAEVTAKSAPDGYTLLLANVAHAIADLSSLR